MARPRPFSLQRCDIYKNDTVHAYVIVYVSYFVTQKSSNVYTSLLALFLIKLDVTVHYSRWMNLTKKIEEGTRLPD